MNPRFLVNAKPGVDAARLAKIIEAKGTALGLPLEYIASVSVADSDDEHATFASQSRGYRGGPAHQPGSIGLTSPFFRDGHVVSDVIFARRPGPQASQTLPAPVAPMSEPLPPPAARKPSSPG